MGQIQVPKVLAKGREEREDGDLCREPSRCTGQHQSCSRWVFLDCSTSGLNFRLFIFWFMNYAADQILTSINNLYIQAAADFRRDGVCAQLQSSQTLDRHIWEISRTSQWSTQESYGGECGNRW